MKNKRRRILIGLVIPIFATTLFSVAFFYKNELKSLLEEVKAQEEILQETMPEEMQGEDGVKIVKLTKNNWDKYFEIEIAPELVWNETGELEKVQYATYVSLKKEYHDKISLTQRESYLDMTGLQPIEMMQYEITDATSGEWKLTKKQTEGLVIGGRNRMFLWWNSADTKDKNFVSAITFDCGEYMGNLVVEVPGEPQVQAAEGMLVLKK